MVFGISAIVPNTKNQISEIRYQGSGIRKGPAQRLRRSGAGEGGWHAEGFDPVGRDGGLSRVSGGTAREVLRARQCDDRRILAICFRATVMPPDDRVMPAILPEPAALGAEKFSMPLPAGAAPEDVRHWFDLETIAELPAPVASFADAAEAAAHYRRASRSENTRRAYRAAVARFTDWCAVHGRTALPASPETVAAFLAAEARSNLAVNTLRLRHAAIRYMHLLAGCPPPTAAAVVSTTFAGIKRQHRRPLNKKTALVLERLLPAIQAIPETLPGLRDRALLLVGFAAALRPSEIARLTLEHVTRHADGIELFLLRPLSPMPPDRELRELDRKRAQLRPDQRRPSRVRPRRRRARGG
jgi:integrase